MEDRHLFVDISICGSQVCLCLGGAYPYDTIVWEWTTGKLIFVSFRANPPNSLSLRCWQDYNERNHSAFLFPAEGQLFLAANYWSEENADSHAVLELYDTSSIDPGKIQCVFTLPKRFGGHTSVEIYSGDSYHYHPSTFYTLPEDRILTIFVEEAQEPYSSQHPSHITLIVVFVCTLLRLAQSPRLVEWEEWKQYAWVADHQEAEYLFNYGAFISSSRIIHFSVPPKQQGVMTLEVTTFRPSIIEQSFHTPGDTSGDSPCAEPRRLIGRKASLDVQVGDDGDTEVMMTEDNIVLMTVWNPPDDGLLMLTLQRSAGSKIPNGFRNDHLDFLTILCPFVQFRTSYLGLDFRTMRISGGTPLNNIGPSPKPRI